MTGWERFFVLWAIGYTAVYVPVFLAIYVLGITATISASKWLFFLLPFHFLGLAQNFLAFVLTIHDLYRRPFPQQKKLIWLLLFFFTGGIGWLVYVFRFGLKPRDSEVVSRNSKQSQGGCRI